MRVYCYTENAKKPFLKFDVSCDDMEEAFHLLLQEGGNVREAVAEAMFNEGMRAESAILSRVLISV